MCIIASLIVLETMEEQNGQTERSESPSTHLHIQAMPDVGLNDTA